MWRKNLSSFIKFLNALTKDELRTVCLEVSVLLLNIVNRNIQYWYNFPLKRSWLNICIKEAFCCFSFFSLQTVNHVFICRYQKNRHKKQQQRNEKRHFETRKGLNKMRHYGTNCVTRQRLTFNRPIYKYAPILQTNCFGALQY